MCITLNVVSSLTINKTKNIAYFLYAFAYISRSLQREIICLHRYSKSSTSSHSLWRFHLIRMYLSKVNLVDVDMVNGATRLSIFFFFFLRNIQFWENRNPMTFARVFDVHHIYHSPENLLYTKIHDKFIVVYANQLPHDEIILIITKLSIHSIQRWFAAIRCIFLCLDEISDVIWHINSILHQNEFDFFFLLFFVRFFLFSANRHTFEYSKMHK